VELAMDTPRTSRISASYSDAATIPRMRGVAFLFLNSNDTCVFVE